MNRKTKRKPGTKKKAKIKDSKGDMSRIKEPGMESKTQTYGNVSKKAIFGNHIIIMIMWHHVVPAVSHYYPGWICFAIAVTVAIALATVLLVTRCRRARYRVLMDDRRSALAMSEYQTSLCELSVDESIDGNENGAIDH